MSTSFHIHWEPLFEIERWCIENLEQPIRFVIRSDEKCLIIIDNDVDAVHFRLRWDYQPEHFDKRCIFDKFPTRAELRLERTLWTGKVEWSRSLLDHNRSSDGRLIVEPPTP